MRIARFLALCGLGSRRACEEIVRDGQVRVNGTVVTSPAINVNTRSDCVTHRGRRLRIPRFHYFVLNKPRGYTCSARDSHADRLILELLPQDKGHLFSVGRLDRESEGLLIVTNDGELAQHLAHPRYGIRKTYRVTVDRIPEPGTLRALCAGIRDEGELLKADRAEFPRRTPGRVIKLTLSQGHKREIRRLCSHFGLGVERLVRVRIGPVGLKGVSTGHWRHLSEVELAGLRRACSLSADGTP